jgi:hypothetical protein
VNAITFYSFTILHIFCQMQIFFSESAQVITSRSHILSPCPTKIHLQGMV